MKTSLISTVRQRNCILLGLLVALFSIFLPAVTIVFWYSVSVAEYENYGIITILLLVFSMIFVFFEEELISLLRKKTGVQFAENTVVFVVLAMVIVIMLGLFYAWTQIVFSSEIRQVESFMNINGSKGDLVNTGLGLYLPFLALWFVVWSILWFASVQQSCELVHKKLTTSAQWEKKEHQPLNEDVETKEEAKEDQKEKIWNDSKNEKSQK